MFTSRKPLRVLAGSLLLAAGAVAPATTALADDDELGAYVYAATCDDLSTDAIIEDIGELELQDDSDDVDEFWTVLGADQDSPSELYAEDDDIDDVTLQQLVDEPHAIAVHAEDARDADVIACGDIEGTVDDGFLLFDLGEVDGSGYEGRAHLEPDDDDDGDDDDGDVDTVVGAWPAGEVEPLASPTTAT